MKPTITHTRRDAARKCLTVLAGFLMPGANAFGKGELAIPGQLQACVDAINQFRQDNGLPALAVDKNLMDICARHVKVMAQIGSAYGDSLIGPELTEYFSWADMIWAGGYYPRLGYTIPISQYGKSMSGAEAAFWWETSPGHRAVLLAGSPAGAWPPVKDIGVGKAGSGFWVCILGSGGLGW